MRTRCSTKKVLSYTLTYILMKMKKWSFIVNIIWWELSLQLLIVWVLSLSSLVTVPKSPTALETACLLAFCYESPTPKAANYPLWRIEQKVHKTLQKGRWVRWVRCGPLGKQARNWCFPFIEPTFLRHTASFTLKIGRCKLALTYDKTANQSFT